MKCPCEECLVKIICVNTCIEKEDDYFQGLRNVIIKCKMLQAFLNLGEVEMQSNGSLVYSSGRKLLEVRKDLDLVYQVLDISDEMNEKFKKLKGVNDG